MAGPSSLKLSGHVQGMHALLGLAKISERSNGLDQFGVPHVPLLGHGYAVETQNLVLLNPIGARARTQNHKYAIQNSRP